MHSLCINIKALNDVRNSLCSDQTHGVVTPVGGVNPVVLS